MSSLNTLSSSIMEQFDFGGMGFDGGPIASNDHRRIYTQRGQDRPAPHEELLFLQQLLIDNLMFLKRTVVFLLFLVTVMMYFIARQSLRA